VFDMSNNENKPPDSDRLPDTLTDERVREALTCNNEIDIRDVYLVGSTVYAFNRQMGIYLAMIIEDNQLASQCKASLVAMNRQYSRVQDLPRPSA
jgi:hypothetical protein